jgi:hypothetical protein
MCADGGESARWGLVFRVLEQQQQALIALQRQLQAMEHQSLHAAG